jgi:hypothetical protein
VMVGSSSEDVNQANFEVK